MRLDVSQKSLDIDECSPFFPWNILRYILRAKCIFRARPSPDNNHVGTLLNVPCSSCIYHQTKLKVSNSINCTRIFYSTMYCYTVILYIVRTWTFFEITYRSDEDW